MAKLKQLRWKWLMVMGHRQGLDAVWNILFPWKYDLKVTNVII